MSGIDCRHWRDIGDPDAGRCEAMRATVGRGVCNRICRLGERIPTHVSVGVAKPAQVAAPVPPLDPDEAELLAAVDRAVAGKSEGLGDDVARLLHQLGADRAVKWLGKVAGGKSCRCNARRKWLNRFWPYN